MKMTHSQREAPTRKLGNLNTQPFGNDPQNGGGFGGCLILGIIVAVATAILKYC